MEFKTIFPTYIGIDTNVDLANKLLPLCDLYTSKTKSNCLNIENFPSTLYDQETEKSVMDEPIVKDAFNYIIDNCLNSFLNHRKIGLPGPLKPFGFFSSMEKYAYLRKHNHLDCLFSGIIYLDVGEEVPPLVLYDPKPVRNFINWPIGPETREDLPLMVFPPYKGLILLWDAYLDHEVPQKLNDNPRKTFVFNL